MSVEPGRAEAVAPWVPKLFVVAALYDLLLGLAGLLAHGAIYDALEITPPNHPAYVQFPSAVVAIFGVAFWLVARDPARNRDIIKLGVLFKLAYAGTVLGHRLFGDIPSFWTVFAWCDLAFAAGFVLALGALPSR